MREKILDVTGKQCPIPVLRARKEIQKMEIGDVLVVMATDMGTKRDIPQFCDATGHELISIDEVGLSLVFRIIKK